MGEFEEDKLEWGSLILAPWRGRGVGRGTGQYEGPRGRGSFQGDPGRGRGRDGFGRGNGSRGTVGTAFVACEDNQVQESWRWNATNRLTTETDSSQDKDTTNRDTVMSDMVPAARKRLQMEPSPTDSGNLPLTIVEKETTASKGLNQIEADSNTVSDPLVTPQKNLNKNKLKDNLGEAVDTLGLVDGLDAEKTGLETCRRVTPPKRGWSDYRGGFERGLNT